MRRFCSWIVLLLVLICPLAGMAVGTPIPSAPVMWCTDKAGFLSGQAEHDVDFTLFDFERKTGHQVIVYIAKTTGGVSIEEWAAKAFKAWGIGKKGKDDGVALFVFADDRTLRIEVGYGLEGDLPDAIASRIIREIMLPKIDAGDRDGAVREGVKAILASVSGQPIAWGGAAETKKSEVQEPAEPEVTVTGGGLTWWQVVILVIVGIAFLILLITHPSIALWLIFEIFVSAISGGEGGGGGGFSGGGGSSGGGGASGSW